VAALLRLADAYEAADRTEDMIAAAKRSLSLDPLQEHVHRRLMLAYRRQRRFDMALRQFAELRQLLADELGVTPEAPTLTLVKEINAARGGTGGGSGAGTSGGQDEPPPAADRGETRPATEARPATPNRPSLAVLAFRSLSDHPEAAYFGEGIAEDVIIELSREANLLVVSRQSSFRFDAQSQDIADIGQQLGVRFLLAGTIRLMGNHARVTAHLVRCEDNSEVWADRYDRDLSDLLGIQAEIARTVTGTVIGRIADAEIESVRDLPVENLDAYLLVLRGINHMHALSREDFDKAIELFDRALAIDPYHGRALGLKAMTMIYRRWYFDIEAGVDDAVALAQAALKVDRRDAKAHCALGVGHMLSREFSRSRYHFEAGLAANPNDDQLLIEYGRFLMYVDRGEEGLMRIREAMRLNPFHPNWYWNMMGRCLHTLGRYDEAVDAFERIVEPPFYIHAYLAACYARLGNGSAADAARQRLLRARPDFDLERFTQVLPYQNEATRQSYLDSLRDAGLG
jgi:adenylate cyclase